MTNKNIQVIMKRVKVVDALVSTDYGKDITVKGWVRSHRSSKAVDFIALNDGSTIKNIQVVVSPEVMDAELLKAITTGACIRATGTLVESQGAGQSVEIQAKEIEIYGLCPSDYPMQKKGQSFEYMRQYAHMRLRTNTFGAVFRIRHNMAIAIHRYFHEHGFYYFHKCFRLQPLTLNVWQRAARLSMIKTSLARKQALPCRASLKESWEQQP